MSAACILFLLDQLWPFTSLVLLMDVIFFLIFFVCVVKSNCCDFDTAGVFFENLTKPAALPAKIGNHQKWIPCFLRFMYWNKFTSEADFHYTSVKSGFY